jgi:hypothetical protein
VSSKHTPAVSNSKFARSVSVVMSEFVAT